MPNWAYTSYVVCSDKKEDIQDLLDKMDALENMEESLIENDFGKTWLGNLVHLLGGDYNTVYCRGYWIDVYIGGDGNLYFCTETAWGEMNEFRHFIESKYPGMKIYYISEESGLENYQTNDINGKFFQYRYVVSCEFYGQIQEFKTKDEAKECIEEVIKRKLKDDEDMGEVLDNWGERNGQYAYYYEYKITND